MTDLSTVFQHQRSPLQKLQIPLFEDKDLSLFIKRDDLLDASISGNKWRKLKYNLLEIERLGKRGIVTFGGAFSNHLHAVAAAGQRYGFETAGIIRGERSATPSPTILDCEKMGMHLIFVSREAYKQKKQAEEVKEILKLYPDFLLLPEGGANDLALKGCAEILEEITVPLDYLCTACGTGTTLAGLALGNKQQAQLLGFPVLKGAEQSIHEAFTSRQLSTDNCRLIPDYHFGGYAKRTPDLLDFIRSFEKETSIRLEQVYTGKMLYGVFDLVRKGFFERGSTIVALHTGGLQGRLPELNY